MVHSKRLPPSLQPMQYWRYDGVSIMAQTEIERGQRTASCSNCSALRFVLESFLRASGFEVMVLTASQRALP